ncbi:unnamed protein product, partial [Mesorhabditis belari]|uniref:Uncharacterized protein n=1 Tax=Mesorhabditis belari TaxID=2138241 RepID=A0AAF3ESC3_9BILA
MQRHLDSSLFISPSNFDEVLLRPVKRMSEDDEECKSKKNAFPILAHVLEEVCLLCNELYSHVEANVRARCRANCFKNPMVGKCMARFAPRDVMDPEKFQF